VPGHGLLPRARPSRSQRLATPALVSVSVVVKVLETTMNRVVAGFRSRTVSRMSAGSMLDTNRQVSLRSEYSFSAS
jgi:hypothetical protein